MFCSRSECDCCVHIQYVQTNWAKGEAASLVSEHLRLMQVWRPWGSSTPVQVKNLAGSLFARGQLDSFWDYFINIFKVFLLFPQLHQLFLHVRASGKLLVCLSRLFLQVYSFLFDAGESSPTGCWQRTAQWAQDNIKHILFDCNAKTPDRVLWPSCGKQRGSWERGKNFIQSLRVLFQI